MTDPTETAADRTAALAEDLRYVLKYRGPGHAHERPGFWDTSGEPCTHCARMAVARANLVAYDADPAAVSAAAPSADRAALRDRIAEALYEACMTEVDAVGPLADAVLAVLPAPADRAAEIDQLRKEHETWRKLGRRNLERAREENARLRADHAAALERIGEAVRRLAAHAVGFQDVLDDTDRGPWGRTVGADIAELRRLADEAPVDPAHAPGMPCEYGCRAAADELSREANIMNTETDEARCDVEFEGGSQCSKAAGHRTLANQDPHTPAEAADTETQDGEAGRG